MCFKLSLTRERQRQDRIRKSEKTNDKDMSQRHKDKSADLLLADTGQEAAVVAVVVSC